MKKIYYFSKKKLQFIEVKNFGKNVIFLTAFFTIVLTFIFFSGYYLIHNYTNSHNKIRTLQAQNKELRSLYSKLDKKYRHIDASVEDIVAETMNYSKETSDNYNEYISGSKFSNELSDAFTLKQTIDKAESFFSSLNRSWENISSSFRANEGYVNKDDDLYNTIPSIKPCKGIVEDIFGVKVHPVLEIPLKNNGIKIVTAKNSEVLAPGAGKVIYIGKTPGHGWTIKIKHGYGFMSVLSNLSKVKVKKWQKVKRNELIAYTGNLSKLNLGPHLYYEIYHDDKPLNPVNFMYDNLKIFDQKTEISNGET